MNVLFYLHQFPAIGGIETVTATLSNYFVRKGHTITIVSHKSKQNADVTVALRNGIDVLRMPDAENVTCGNTEFLKKIIINKKIDVVIFQDSYAEIEKNLFVKDVNCCKIVCEHSSPFYLFGQRIIPRPFIIKLLWHFRHPFWKWRRLRHESNRRRFLYDNCNRYILLSNRFFGEFRAVTQLWDTRKLRAIPNPLLPASVRPICKKRNEIIFASTLSWDKGIQRVLPLWKGIHTRFPDWKFTIVGDGEMMSWAKEYIVHNGLKNVSLEGSRPDCGAYFQRAKILVYPSSRDGWGLILVEAMANGCVPIAFESFAAVRDIIDDGENGILVPAFDLAAYGVAIERLTSDYEKLEMMSLCARNKAGKFSIDVIAAKWEALIAESMDTCS